MKKSILESLILVFALISISACTKKESETKDLKSLSLEELKDRGKAVYIANCIACHNLNPHLDGSVGPNLKGTTLEVLYQKVTRGTYPQGYQPKRSTSVMTKFPHLENEIPALNAYLQSFDQQ